MSKTPSESLPSGIARCQICHDGGARYSLMGAASLQPHIERQHTPTAFMCLADDPKCPVKNVTGAKCVKRYFPSKDALIMHYKWLHADPETHKMRQKKVVEKRGEKERPSEQVTVDNVDTKTEAFDLDDERSDSDSDSGSDNDEESGDESKPERRTTRAATIKSSPAKSTARPGTPRFIGSDVESEVGQDDDESDEEEDRVVRNTRSVTKSPMKTVRDGNADSDGSDIIYDGNVDNTSKSTTESQKCSICSKELKASTLIAHMRTHNVTNFVCTSGCVKTYFPTPDALKTHVKTQHKDEFACDWKDCTQKFATKAGLSKHKSAKHKKKRTIRGTKTVQQDFKQDITAAEETSSDAPTAKRSKITVVVKGEAVDPTEKSQSKMTSFFNKKTK